jgi:hypothetical protein
LHKNAGQLVLASVLQECRARLAEARQYPN